MEGHVSTGASSVHSFAGLLIDMDGTIVDSTEAIVKHWHKIGKELGADPNVILATSHGRRSIDTLRIYDPKLANWEYVSKIEGLIPKEFGQDAVEIPGGRALLDELERLQAPWAIVTSGTRPLVTGWLEVLQLAHPRHLVVAEDVEKGKPDPACYVLGRQRLGLSPGSAMLVLEDSPSGIRAGKAAGCKVVGLTTTHSVDQIREAGADWIVDDLRAVRVKGRNHGTRELEVEICAG
ncbi:MAG: hypothetical protein M1817_001594 [Caeruleum heppii]|nr:MAG: hypothetical protein M1817_001594 [Caeruleum heppii]